MKQVLEGGHLHTYILSIRLLGRKNLAVNKEMSLTFLYTSVSFMFVRFCFVSLILLEC